MIVKKTILEIKEESHKLYSFSTSPQAITFPIFILQTKSLINIHSSHQKILQLTHSFIIRKPPVVFHQTAVPVTPLSTWITYPKRSSFGYSTCCLAEAWLSAVDSLFYSRCQTYCPIEHIAPRP